jgi:hypothetical protein
LGPLWGIGCELGLVDGNDEDLDAVDQEAGGPGREQ